MLEIEPSLLVRRDNNGMTPLHTACNTGSSLEVIRVLLQHHHHHHSCSSSSTSRTNTPLGVPPVPAPVPAPAPASSLQPLQDYRSMTPLHHLLNYICFPFYDKVENKHSSSNAIYNSANFSFQFTRGGGGGGGGSVPRTIVMAPNTSSSDDDHQPDYTDGFRNGNILNMTLPQDQYDECLLAVDELLTYQPESMRLSDKNGYFPIDILHNFIACNPPDDVGINVERARLLCKKLRKLSINLYKLEKAKCEEQRDVDENAEIFTTTAASTMKTDGATGYASCTT